MPAQLSLFSAEQQPPRVEDLEGLLAGPGQAVLRPGAPDAGRLSVVVEQAWRVDALLAAYAERGVAGESVPAEGGGRSAQTSFSPALAGPCRRWSLGGRKQPPAGFVLDGPRLRLWCLAAGAPDVLGYRLALGPHDDAAWAGVGAALAAAGLAGTFVGPRADGPAYRIVGQRRLRRLRELVGDPPPGTPEEAWPSG